MKKVLILILALALLLCGCAQKSDAPAADNAPAAEEPAQPQEALRQWDYDIAVEEAADEYKHDDGMQLAQWHYERLRMHLKSDNGEIFAGEAPERGVTEAQLAVCKTFNDAMDARADAARARWEDLKAGAMEQYTEMREAFLLNGVPYEEDTTVSFERRGDLLEITENMYGYWGGVHGGNTFETLHFDLGAGEFLTIHDLSDDPAALRRAIADEVIRQIYEQDMAEACFDDFDQLLYDMEDYTGFFTEDGLQLIFEQYAIAPYASGTFGFTIPYAQMSRYFTDRAMTLLNVPSEERVLGNFYEAQEMYAWFRMTTMPLDYDRPAPIEGYYAVDYPGVTTMNDLRNLLMTRFSDELAIGLLAPVDGFEHYKEIDGVLYAVGADRGSDVTVAGADYAVAWESAEAGQVIATVHHRAFDEAKEEWVLTDDTTVEFPFVWTPEGARFSSFTSID